MPRFTSDEDDDVSVEVVIARETNAAVLVGDDEDSATTWLPLSRIEISHNDPRPGVATITMPRWLAEDRGLV